MPTNVIFPKVSLEMASGRISRWIVAEGDTVSEGQVLFEIDNDKAAVEVEARAPASSAGSRTPMSRSLWVRRSPG